MSDTSPIEGVELEGFIRGRARLEHTPTDVDAVVSALSLPDADAWRRAEQGWRARVDENEQLARIVELFLATYLEELRGNPPEGEEHRDKNDAGAEPPQPPRQEVPSYLQQHAAPPPFVAPPLSPPAPSPPSGQPPPAAAMPPIAAAEPPGTAPLDLEKLRGILASGPTPFAGKTSPERLQQLRADNSPEAERAFARLMAGTDSVDETMALPSAVIARTQVATAAFEMPSEPGAFPELTVDRYAALAAELQGKGPSAEILARYEITSPMALLALTADQERRFLADPALRARFEERKKHFLSFMKPAK